MNSTENSGEIRKIKEIADQIHADNDINGVFTEGPSSVTDYISDYYFDTPIELTEKLNSYWDKLGKEYMKVFTTVITVAAFKNKDSKEDHYKDISPLIYEF